MKNNLLEHIILYVIVACVALVIATLARISAASMGFDSFTTFIVFVVVIAIQIVIYLSIHVILQNLMLPWIEKWIAKIPFFRKRIEEKTKTIDEVVPSEIINESVSLEDIRDKQRQNIAKEQNEKQNIVLDYTRKCFALYVSDEQLEILLQNVQIYINNLDMKDLKPVKVKELTISDLRHFGWNLWNHFKPRKQEDIAYFLKIVFPDVFRDAEIESIKRHLKDDEKKGMIKIKNVIK